MSENNGRNQKICGKCGEAMPKAQTIHEGIAYCAACYHQDFKPVACEECGKTMRTPGGTTPAVCRSCRAKDRKCVRCGKLVPHAGLTVDEGVACPSCARYFKEPQGCPVCGQYSLHLARDLKKGFTEPACQRCRRKGHINCPVCGKNRHPAGTISDGRLVCAICLDTDGKPYQCPRCGRTEGKRHSSSSCDLCYWEDSTIKRLKDAMVLLNHAWVRDSFEAFIPELMERVGSQKAALRLAKYFLFFARLDASFPEPKNITASMLMDIFSREGLRRHAVPYGFLVKTGIMPAQAEHDLEAAAELAAREKMLIGIKGLWYGVLLKDFHRHLEEIGMRYESRGWTGDRRRFTPRTQTSDLRAALRFMESLDTDIVRSSLQIEQIHLERFLMYSPGYRDGIRAFVRFLNNKKKVFKKLILTTVSRNLSPELFLSKTRYEELLKTWLSPEDDRLKESLICLLMLLYAQKVNRVVRLKLSDISQDRDGNYHIGLGNTVISLDPRISQLFDRYLAERKAIATMEDDWENLWLFSGRTHGSHLTEAAVSYHLKKHSVSAETLFSTAIFYAYLRGLRHPKVLVKAFGITDATAIKYLELIDPRLRDEAEAKVDRTTMAQVVNG